MCSNNCNLLCEYAGLPLMFCLLVPPDSATITPPATTAVGAVFTCISQSGFPPVIRYEWKYRLKPDGDEVDLGSGDTWALTGDVIYG